MDQPPHVQAKSRSWTIVAAATGALVLVAVGALVVLGPAAERPPLDPVIAGPPPGSHPIASGRIDGVDWQQYAWSAQGELMCISFSGGASSADCKRWDTDASPFVMVEGDSPITDGRSGATVTVIQGVVTPTVTGLRVVEPSGSGAVGSLTTCLCAPSRQSVTVFMLPVTLGQTSVDADGRYVMVGAFDEQTELGRVRVPILNLGYCGLEDCQ